MKPEDWQQIDQVFCSALEREPEERAAFLDEACGGDAELRREVESLLAAEAEAENTTNALPTQIVAAMLASEGGGITVGQHIGHYRVLAPLGAGGMGEVYLAQDTSLGRKVALKFLPAGITANEEARRRFTREARAASALAHPHICTIHEIGEDNGRRFIVMEYVEGETLAAKLKRERLSVEDCLVFATQITDALAEAHTHQIIHRDIKPANIVITSRGQAKVLDFGLAKFLRKDEGGGMRDESEKGTLLHPSSLIPHPSTMPGVVMGTVPYMSPEQVRRESLDARTDIFSLGTMFYEMLSGRQPFARPSAAETMAAILTEEPEPLGEVAPEIERVVRRCLAKKRELRYPSARELLNDLVQLKGGNATATQSVPTDPQRQTPSTQIGNSAVTNSIKRPARGLVVAALVVVVVLIGVLVAWQMSRAPGATPSEIKSLAVLPLRPLPSTTRDEALELGTTSTLITRLGSLRQLIVRPESAVGRYANSEQDPLAAGREQKVDAVLDNRYMRSGDKLRFQLRLLRVADGATLWADTLDQQTADSFAIEDALSAKVTVGLKLTLSEADKELLAKRYTKSAEAWQLYVRGRLLLHTRQTPNIEKAITYFEQAIALDPGFALAYAKLGHAYASLSWVGQAPP
ncbi:MAG TPA: protein kinase, partial [Blastocatellia bacterium]|nr:protein kinase [Blastocatellia bacterium]